MQLIRRVIGNFRAGCAAFLISMVSCDPFGVRFDDVEPAEHYRARELRTAEVPETLRVMTYNIKFGGGRIDFFFDCHGDEVLMNDSEVRRHLDGLAEKIRSFDPDVIFLQEVDTNSKRTAFIDQVQWLLDYTDLNYGYYASQWRSDFVPSDGIGAVDSGNAILSKFSLQRGTRLALPLRTDQGDLEKYFYLRRNLLIADLDVGADEPIRLVAGHAEAFAQDGTKKEHIERFEQQLRDAPGLVIGGADLNALPPETRQVQGFEDSVCEDEDFQADDYSQETTWLSSLYEQFNSAIPLEDYAAENEAHFTHTTDKAGYWNRKLDYLFTNMTVVRGSGMTHQGESSGGMATMPLSDHAPLSMEVMLP